MLASVTFHLVFVVLLFQSSCHGKRKTNPGAEARVLGGNPAPRERFPYICSLRTRGAREHACGGTLVKSQWVLTAAHCVDPAFDGSTGLSPIIYCGIYERDEEKLTKVFAADRTFIHPKWIGEITDGFDIALIKMNKPYDSAVPHMETTGNFYTSGSVFSALGWGFDSSASFADLLQIANRLPFITGDICNQKKYWDGRIKNSMICAGIGAQETARGDSGGPLLLLDFPHGDYTLGKPSYDLLVGITSFGEESRENFKPGVYTSVGYFRDWIDCIVEEKKNCSKDGTRSTKSSDKAKESKSTSSNAIQIEQNTTHVSPTPGASSVPLNTSGDSSAVSPESLVESSIEDPESLADGSEEATQKLEVLLDVCSDITPLTFFNKSEALERAREAIKEDASETVEELLCSGLSPRRTFTSSVGVKDWTLLHTAARHDAIRSARVLIKNGANIEKRNRDYERPLHIAAKRNSAKVAKFLVKSGASIEAPWAFKGYPLHAAAYYDSEDVAELLVDSGAYMESRVLFRETTPLHIAASRNSLAVAKLLLSKGADIQSEDYYDRTPLYHTAVNNAVGIAKLLIDIGANISHTTRHLETPLHYAAEMGSLEIAEILVDNGADVNASESVGLTPLHSAARSNAFNVAKFLIKNGAAKRKTNKYGKTPYGDICRNTSSGCSPKRLARFQKLLKV